MTSIDSFDSKNKKNRQLRIFPYFLSVGMFLIFAPTGLIYFNLPVNGYEVFFSASLRLRARYFYKERKKFSRRDAERRRTKNPSPARGEIIIETIMQPLAGLEFFWGWNPVVPLRSTAG
jgi:hypothetical protein